jgi:hypothetical protein
MAATLYLISNSMINLYCKKRWHIKLMWFGGVSCTLLWFTFTKVRGRAKAGAGTAARQLAPRP